jgi:hypothetical protein
MQNHDGVASYNWLGDSWRRPTVRWTFPDNGGETGFPSPSREFAARMRQGDGKPHIIQIVVQ